ncbi:hypothetical protein ACFPQ7_09540 [Methylobacterium iners]
MAAATGAPDLSLLKNWAIARKLVLPPQALSGTFSTRKKKGL